MAAPRFETSTGQPVTVRPKNGITHEVHITKRMAFAGVPSLLRTANQRGRIRSSDMAYIRRLVAMNVAMMPVSCAASIAPPITGTPAGPSALRAAANTGIASRPLRPGSAAM